MRRHVILLCLTVLALSCARGRTPTLSPADRGSGPLLWRIERDGVRSYLFGTIHSGVTMRVGLQAIGLERLDGARRVVLELDLDEPDSVAAMRAEVAKLGTLPPHQSLRSMLSTEHWKILVDLHTGVLPPAALERLKPWFAALSTVMRLEARRAAAAGQAGDARPVPMDLAIARRALESGIPVIGLETIRGQLLAVANLGRAEGLALLNEVLADVDGVSTELAEMNRAYTASDNAEALSAYVAKSARENPAATEILLFRRNHRWVAALERLLHEEGSFIAIGAAHLVGPHGLVDLLRARGYTVTRETGHATPARTARPLPYMNRMPTSSSEDAHSRSAASASSA